MALKRATKNTFSKEDIASLGKEYALISKRIKELEAKKKSLADQIKQGAEQYGVKDDRGSFYFESDNFVMGKVAKKSMKINQEKAVTTLVAMGIGDVVDTITTQVVNEDRLTEAVNSGRLSFDVVEGFTDVSVSYSVSVVEREELPEVEQTTFKKGK